jgi:hypothetical protein
VYFEGVLKNRVLRKVFGFKRDEITGEWRRIHDEELHTKYCSGDQVKKGKIGGDRNTCGERKGAYRDFVGRNLRERSLGRPR